MSRTQFDASLMIGGGTLLVAGSFMAWAVLLGTGVSGIDGGDGWMTVAGALVLIAFAVRLLLRDAGLPLWLAWGGLATAIGVAGINLIDIMSTGGDDVAVGSGMRLMVLGGFVAFVGLTRHSLTHSSTKWPNPERSDARTSPLDSK